MEAVDSVVKFRRGTAALSKGGTVKVGDIEGLDEVVVSIFRAPHSYTGEDCAEIGCHGSEFIVKGILERLFKAGARMATPGEFTQRAFLAGKMDLSQAEAVADIVAAGSEAAHRVALNQLRGRYSSELSELRGQLLELTSLLELELDFSEEDVEFADRCKLKGLLRECLSHIDELRESFRIGNAIRNGVPVAIVGAPNSGKSTLLNAIVGDDRAIVSDVPGTTRDTVEETITLRGVQYRFIDTAGIHDTEDTVELMGIERSLKKIALADTVVCLLDGTAPAGVNEASLELVRSRIGDGQRLIVAVSKADIATAGSGVFGPGCGAMAISAKTGKGLDKLVDAITADYDASALEDHSIVTSQRHYEALCRAHDSLTSAATALETGVPSDLVSEDLRSTLTHIGSILGDEICTDEVLGNIFGRFCVGK